MSEYTENFQKAQRLVTRNRNNVKEINEPSFWINDEKQPDGSNQIEISNSSNTNWLKITQKRDHVCSLFPIDGNNGVFLKNGLPVSDKSKFVYQWYTNNGIENKDAGDCDCLILDEKWRFFEFKVEAYTQDLKQINNNRNKAEAQLAKSMTSFKEQLADSSLECECIIVVPGFFSFPKFKADFSRNVRFRKLFGIDLIEIAASGNQSYDLSEI